jgi:hypothetical protein
MAVAWIVLSTKWDFANVQATLNVIISVLGTTGIWAFSRFWWQFASSRVIRKDSVPLSSLFTFSSPGEAWDVLVLLRKTLFAPRHFHLLAQLIVIFTVTVATTLAGPIARFSLRSGHLVQQTPVKGLAAVMGEGALGARSSASVLWNLTMQSLDDADFPRDQLLDFLPPSTQSWRYKAEEWDPTWRVECNGTEETPLEIIANASYPIADPTNAFPALRDSIDPLWFNTSIYRASSDFNGWFEWKDVPRGKDVLIYLLIQSDPLIDDQMHKNQKPLHLLLATIRLHNATITSNSFSLARTTWRMEGPVGNASYSQTECIIKRKLHVADEEMIPWPWTNDTNSITKAYADHYRLSTATSSVNNQSIPLLSPDQLFRFYQVYQVTTSTVYQVPLSKNLSIQYTTVELSTIFLAILLLLFILTTAGSIRYIVFYFRHKSTLALLYVPDGKLEWMIHAVKNSNDIRPDELQFPDRAHFQTATFGRQSSGTQGRQIARVQSRLSMSQTKCLRAKSSIVTASVAKSSKDDAKDSTDITPNKLPPSLSVGSLNEKESNMANNNALEK